MFIVSFLFAVEFLCRIIYKNAEKIPQLAWGFDAVEEIMGSKRRVRGQFSPRTYGLYWQADNYFSNGFKQTDINGFRWKGYDVPKTKSTIRILAYGGSTTFSNHFLPNPQDCWPHLLEQRLNSDSQVSNVEVINAGLNYGMTPEILCHFVFEGSTFSPDILILHGPGNDMLPVSCGDSSLDYRYTRKIFSTNSRKFEREILRFSGIARIIYTLWLRGSNLIQLEPESIDQVWVQNDRLQNLRPVAFENNVKTLVDLCFQRNIKVVLIDFILAPKEKLETLKPGLSDGIIEFTKKSNDFFAQLAENSENRILHIDSRKFAIDNKQFGDTCHLYKDGEISKADTIYKEIRTII